MSRRSAPKPAPRSAFSTASAAAVHARLLVGEQVDVGGEPVDDPVRHQGVTAAQSEPVPRGRAQRDRGHLAVELGRPASGRSGRGSQDRVLVLPRLPDARRQEQARATG